MRALSKRTLAELLGAALRERGAFQLFARRIGPEDVVYLSAKAFRADGRIVEAKASSEVFEHAFVQLLDNLDEAVADEPSAEPEPVLVEPRARRVAPKPWRGLPGAPSTLSADSPAQTEAQRMARIAMKLLAKWGSVNVERFAGATGHTKDHARDALVDLVDRGELARSKRFGFVAPDSPEADR